MNAALAMVMLASLGAAGPDEYVEFNKGDLIPDVTLQDLEGRSVRLRDFVGRKVLVCTWASW